MITFVSGELLSARPTSVVVGVNGIGYEIIIPLSSFERLPGRGENVTVLTHLQVKEDGLVLYGFLTEEERSLFRMLIGVSGIGPKIAVTILSGISPANFKLAVGEGSAGMLASVPGIGRKKAERIIMELKDKVGAMEIPSAEGAIAAEDHVVGDAVRALLSLGYTRVEAHKAVTAAAGRGGRINDVETLIREALKAAS